MAKEWLGLLEGLGVVYLLKPFSGKALKRLAKSPKLWFCDTGLRAWLARWPTGDTLMSGAAAGRFLKNFVVSELVKGFSAARRPADLSCYRDSNAKEIDLIVAREGRLHPFGIKLFASPDGWTTGRLGFLDGLPQERGNGGIICRCEDVIPITGRDCFIPCNII